MSDHRPVRHYSTLPEIIEALRPGAVGNDQTYVGKQYPKSALIDDLQKILEAQDGIGKWLSAALDDPAVCDEMKQDISRWFGVLEV